jgi:hypothetical protein
VGATARVASSCPLPGYTSTPQTASKREARKKLATAVALPALAPILWDRTSHFPPPPPHTTFSRVYTLDLMALVHDPRPITAAKKASLTPALPPSISIFIQNRFLDPSLVCSLRPLLTTLHAFKNHPHPHTGSPYRVVDGDWAWRWARDAGQVRLEGWKDG